MYVYLAGSSLALHLEDEVGRDVSLAGASLHIGVTAGGRQGPPTLLTGKERQGKKFPGGYSHVKAYRDVPPKWVTFSPKILRHGSHFGQKNP